MEKISHNYSPEHWKHIREKLQVKTYLRLTGYPNTWARNCSFWATHWRIVHQKYPTSFKLNFFSINLIQIKFHCYFCKVYEVAVTKQLNCFYLITIHENYCNSKKVLNLLPCVFFFLSYFLHEKKELPKLWKLKEYEMINTTHNSTHAQHTTLNTRSTHNVHTKRFSCARNYMHVNRSKHL